jgi:transcription elongation GreA/GreB family factor
MSRWPGQGKVLGQLLFRGLAALKVGRMSSAFTKEQEDDNPREDLPDRPVSPHRNLVTPEGLQQIDDALTRLHGEIEKATAADDHHALALAQRDLRYWTARRASAEIVRPITDHSVVRFGHKVVVELEGGERRVFRLVGEDEADPSQELIPYVAPLAQALMGKSVGDKVEVIHHSARIIEVA